MDDRTLIALMGSIQKWENIVAGTQEDRGLEDCPLCMLFHYDTCDGCPVKSKTGMDGCKGSPYDGILRYQYPVSATRGYTDKARDALDFLKSLLPQRVKRYRWYQTEEDECCLDRKTNTTIISYDLGDPANYNPSYGGWSKAEYLKNVSRDPDEEIDVSESREPIHAGEVERHHRAKAHQLQRDQEGKEARQLENVIPDAFHSFNFDNYKDGEIDILGPALEALGYTKTSFYMVEQDSFGPLIRGCVASDLWGKRVRFFYG